MWEIDRQVLNSYIIVSLFSYINDKETIHFYGNDNRDNQVNNNKEKH